MKITLPNVEHIPWQEQLYLLEDEALQDDLCFDDLLEAGEVEYVAQTPSAKRVLTPKPNFRRSVDSPTIFNASLLEASNHAKAVLANLGL